MTEVQDKLNEMKTLEEQYPVIQEPAITGEHYSMGKSYVWLRCYCGQSIQTYLWSWAGHGFRKCPRCKRRIPYLKTRLAQNAY